MKRSEAVCKKQAVPGLVLPAYYLFVRYTGISIPCMFHTLTGLKCPGCGITHMMMDIAEGDFRSAMQDNMFLFITLPFVVFEMIYCIRLRRNGACMDEWNNRVVYVYVISLIAFGIARNVISFI